MKYWLGCMQCELGTLNMSQGHMQYGLVYHGTVGSVVPIFLQLCLTGALISALTQHC